MTRVKFRRRKYVTDPKAQLKVTLVLASVAIIGAFIIYIVGDLRLTELSDSCLKATVPPAELPPVFLKLANKLILQVMGLVLLMTIILVGLGIFLTHNITGPIYKLKSDLVQFLETKGKSGYPVRFRTTDEFQDLLPIINEVLKHTKFQ